LRTAINPPNKFAFANAPNKKSFKVLCETMQAEEGVVQPTDVHVDFEDIKSLIEERGFRPMHNDVGIDEQGRFVLMNVTPDQIQGDTVKVMFEAPDKTMACLVIKNLSSIATTSEPSSAPMSANDFCVE
jgi:hypothetical protein